MILRWSGVHAFQRVDDKNREKQASDDKIKQKTNTAKSFFCGFGVFGEFVVDFTHVVGVDGLGIVFVIIPATLFLERTITVFGLQFNVRNLKRIFFLSNSIWNHECWTNYN